MNFDTLDLDVKGLNWVIILTYSDDFFSSQNSAEIDTFYRSHVALSTYKM